MVRQKVRIVRIEDEVLIGRIYKLYNTIDEKVYIGSTNKTLVKRMGDHAYCYSINTNMQLYHHMHKVGIDNFVMKLLEYKVVNNVQELRQLEQKWINRENPENLLNGKNASKVQIVKPIIEELIEKVFEIKMDDINGNENKKEN